MKRKKEVENNELKSIYGIGLLLLKVLSVEILYNLLRK